MRYLILGSVLAVSLIPANGALVNARADSVVTPATSSADEDFSMAFDAPAEQYAHAAAHVIPQSGAFTVQAWVYDDSINDGDWRHILSQGQGGTAFYLGTARNSQEIRAGDRWPSTGVNLPVGEWAHLGLVSDGSGAATLYLNGQVAAIKSSGFSAPSVPGARFQMGRQFTDEQYWNGRIDQVKIYSAALDAAAIAADMHSYDMYTGGSITAADHVAFYDFNEGPSGSTGTGTIPNRVANAPADSDLTTVNDPVYVDIAQSGSDGDDSVVFFPRSYLTTAGGWESPAQLSRMRALLVGGGGGGGGIRGGGGGGGGVFDSTTSTVTVSPGVYPVTVGQGSLGVRFDTDTSSYVNGAAAGQTTSAFGLTAGGGGLAGTAEAGRATGADGSPGTAGGSGGGGASGLANSGAGGVPGTGTVPGRAGGTGVSAVAGAGGGGGAGAGGGDASIASTTGASGGDGIASDITGSLVHYGGGGGGGNEGGQTSRSSGGLGGGGQGASSTNGIGESGFANTGGGGGGGTWTGTNVLGGRGGSGVVIIRFNFLPVPPAPAPAVAPSSPVAVMAQPGDASATVSWSAPDNAGSFPITNYQAQVQPGGQSCVVSTPLLSCVVTGLNNGQAYTASVRALNGAGWGPFSAASEPFTPFAPAVESIVITGSRGEVRGRPGVIVRGVTTGMVGQVVTARVRLAGQTTYATGASRAIGDDERFTWQRRTGKTVSVVFDGDAVRSNRVVIRPR